MNNDKSKMPTGKPQPAGPASPAPAKSGPAPAGAKSPPPPPAPRPLFRRTDWLTFLITFAAVWIGYYLTLAPELTLEDSGELATGSMYAGIPHPPGYPVWTIYTWLWTVLLPVKNIAWRVALGEATGGALAAGLLGLLVSRGSSLLMEGMEDLKAMAGRWESAICMVSGFVAGMLIGFNGFMWSQSVIVEVYAFSVASLMAVMLCLLRWIYAPHQRRYLYYALFFHGVCFTNHQTLIVAALGIEIAIAAADYKMGRNLWLGNSIIYLAGLILSSQHILTGLEQNRAIFVIFNVVGIFSIIAYIWFTVLTGETFFELCRDACLAGAGLCTAAGLGLGSWMWLIALAFLGGFFKLAWDTRRFGLEWMVVIICGICWIVGASFYFYMPLAGMTNPPMEWGYPREVGGFIHAFTRGQYEKANPTDIFHDPLRFFTQLGMLWNGIVEEFSWVYVFLAIVPFAFFLKVHRRERAWLIGVSAIYFFLGVLLLILLNPPPDRAAQDLVRVFFTASHTCIALLVGYGLTLIAAYMATHYERFRSWGIIGGTVAIALALFEFTTLTQHTFFGEASNFDLGMLLSFVGQTFTNKDQYGLPVYAGLMLVGMAVLFLVSLFVYRKRAPLALTLGIFALMPAYSIMTHWSNNEQHNHWFGYWFGHDMFTPPFNGSDGKPLYPEMTKDAVLFGGTDPGRFCPTYMVFCESFTPHKCQPAQDQKFDRRDVYVITQNALADGTYLEYIRAQYNRSTQIDQPFFREFFRVVLGDKEYETNTLARLSAPLDKFFTALGDSVEKSRRTYTSWFEPEHFIDLPGLSAKLRDPADPLARFISENLSPQTKQLLSAKSDDRALRQALAKDLNLLIDRELVNKKRIRELTLDKAEIDQEIAAGSASERLRRKQESLQAEIDTLSKVPPLYDPERFKQVQLSDYVTDFIKENPQSHTRVRLNRLLLEAAFPKQIAASLGGVYPDREIYTPTVEDSQKCFNEYLMDAQRRLQMNPPQLKPGEDVKVVDNRVQVSGQVAVMSINGLLTKVIFDHNPKNEFFVEESFPLDWMYPYLSPFGVIMKINRQPLPELTEEIVKRDHDFWKQFSTRLTGDIVDYDTPVKQIADWIEKTYLRRNFSGFKGDRKFVRDDQAQKAFSKLRSSIGGIYAWRINDPNNQNPAARQRMLKEAEFAFKQAFAFCPYSPEAVFRYVQLLLGQNRFDEALTIANTCLKLDPYNSSVIGLVKNLQAYKSQAGEFNRSQQSLLDLEKKVQENPTNFLLAFNLASTYLQLQQTGHAVQVLDGVISNPQVDENAVLAIASAYAQMANYPKLENTLERLVQVTPQKAEAWYDLAALKATLGKAAEAYPALGRALDLSAKRQGQDAKSRDLLAEAQKDPRFNPIRETQEFKKLVTPK